MYTTGLRKLSFLFVVLGAYLCGTLSGERAAYAAIIEPTLACVSTDSGGGRPDRPEACLGLTIDDGGFANIDYSTNHKMLDPFWPYRPHTIMGLWVHVIGEERTRFTLDEARRDLLSMYRSDGAVAKDVILLNASRIEPTVGGPIELYLLSEGGLFRDDYRSLPLSIYPSEDGMWRLWSGVGTAAQPYALDGMFFRVRRRGNTEVGIARVVTSYRLSPIEEIPLERLPQVDVLR